jgi:hypothetical protein
VKNTNKVDRHDVEKILLINLEFFMDPDNPASGSKLSRHFSLFKDGCKLQRSGSSAYLLIFFREIENLMPLKEPDNKTRMFWIFLEGQALSHFDHHLRRRLEAAS